MGMSNHPGERRDHSGIKRIKCANAVACFLVVAAALFTTFVLIRLIPCAAKTDFAVRILSEAGDTVLEDRDVADIRISYITKDAPVFSDQSGVTKEEILSSDSTIVDWKHIVQLPNDITGIRVDLTLTGAVNLKEGDIPTVRLKLNKTKFYDDPEMEQQVLASQPERNHYRFELGEKAVAGSRVKHKPWVPFTLFCIAASVFGAIFSFGRDFVSPRCKDRREDSPEDTVRSSPADVCRGLFSLKGIMIISYLLLSVFPVFHLNSDRIDEWENRTLESFPDYFYFNEATSCFSQIERFVNDRFFGRNFLIGLSDTIKKPLDNRRSEKVLWGNDNWFFYYETLPETKHANFTKEQFSKAGEYINSLSEYAASKGKRFIYVICPDKFRIYGDKLTCYPPDLYLENDIVDEFVDYLKTQYDFPVIYQRQELLQKKTETNHDLYYRYDTHWTEEGAYYGLYLPVLKELSIAPIPIDGWNQKERQDGDLIAYLFRKSSKKPTMPPHPFYEPEFNNTAAIHTVEDPHPLNPENSIIISSNPNGAPYNVLFLRDSFLQGAFNIFANTFQQCVSIWRYRFFESDLEYIDQCDVIILEHVERYIFHILWQDIDPEE